MKINRTRLNEAHEELDFVTQARFDIFHDGDYDLNKLRDDLESLLQDGLDPIEFLGIDAEGLDAQSSYSYSVIGEVDPGNVSSISFDFGNDGNYDYSFIEDCIEKAVNNQGLNWGEYVDYEDVTYAYPEYNSLSEVYDTSTIKRGIHEGLEDKGLELLNNGIEIEINESLKEDFEDYEDRLFYRKSDRLENSVEKRFPGWKIFVEGSWQCGVGSDFIYIYPPDDIKLEDDPLSIYLDGSFLDISNREILKLIAQEIKPVIQANESLNESNLQKINCYSLQDAIDCFANEFTDGDISNIKTAEVDNGVYDLWVGNNRAKGPSARYIEKNSFLNMFESLKEDFVPKYFYRVMKYLYNNDYEGCDEIELEELLMNSPQFHNMSEKTAEAYVEEYLTYYRDPKEFRKLKVDESLKEDDAVDDDNFLTEGFLHIVKE